MNDRHGNPLLQDRPFSDAAGWSFQNERAALFLDAAPDRVIGDRVGRALQKAALRTANRLVALTSVLSMVVIAALLVFLAGVR